MKNPGPVLLLFIIPLVVTNENRERKLESTTSYDHKESSHELSNIVMPEKESEYECEIPWRLPRNILPSHYNITLRINPDDPVFNGSVNIDIKCVEETDRITLHAHELIINLPSINIERKSRSDPAVTISNVTLDDKHEMVHIQTGSSLKEGDFILNIPDFVGKVHDEDVGLFLRTYEVRGEPNTNNTRKLIVSQLQATFARRVFPCFDEPNMKATYTVHIERPAAYKSFSSMPLTNSTPVSQDRVLDTFEKTAMLPTYAIAFLVADYSRYPGNPPDRTSILLPEQDLDKVDDIGYRLTVNALAELESYTKIPYPVSKIEHASVPNFGSEAMENWGLITYWDTYLMNDWKAHSLTKQLGLSLIAHELAHQWFGNMVTADWWSYLWLNEAFATYFQYLISDKLLPDWQLWDQFIVFHYQGALIQDANTEDRKPAMTTRICSPNDIELIFNPINYDKGASFVKMLEFIIGEEEFQGALRMYLQRRLMQNAKPAHFFQVLDEINANLNDSPLPKNLTFKQLGTDWTEQAGFPVITVTRDYTSSSVFVKQERFFDRRSPNRSFENHDNRWWIPLTWSWGSSSQSLPKRPQDWLHADRTLRIYAPQDDWLLFNINVEVFCRVNYDDRNWELLSRGLERSRQDISVPNRIQLIDDAFSLGFAHRLNLGTALNLTRFLQDEDDAVVWMSATRRFGSLFNLMASTPAYPKLENYLQKLTRERYRRIRIDVSLKGRQADKILRETLSNVACLFGLDLCLIDANFALSQFLNDVTLDGERSARKNLHPDIERTVLCGGIQSGGGSLFEEVRSLAVNPTIEKDNQKAYREALTCTKNFDLLTWHLEDIFSNNTLLKDDQAFEAVKSVIDNQRSLYTGYRFVRDNVNKINHYYNCSTNYTESLVKAISSKIRSTVFYDEVHEWIISSNGDELGNKTELLQYLESQKSKVEWSTELVQQVSDWLNTPVTTLPLPIGGSTCSKSAAVSLISFIASLIASLWVVT